MSRLSLFHVTTAAAVLIAGAAGILALTGNLAAALALAGAALALVAVLQLLADRRSARANRTMLSEVHALNRSLGSLSDRIATLGEGLSSLDEKSTLLGEAMETMNETAELARNQAEGAERRLLASVDAARLEAAVARSETSAGASSAP